jgi:hypothetical protein
LQIHHLISNFAPARPKILRPLPPQSYQLGNLNLPPESQLPLLCAAAASGTHLAVHHQLLLWRSRAHARACRPSATPRAAEGRVDNRSIDCSSWKATRRRGRRRRGHGNRWLLPFPLVLSNQAAAQDRESQVAGPRLRFEGIGGGLILSPFFPSLPHPPLLSRSHIFPLVRRHGGG